MNCVVNMRLDLAKERECMVPRTARVRTRRTCRAGGRVIVEIYFFLFNYRTDKRRGRVEGEEVGAGVEVEVGVADVVESSRDEGLELVDGDAGPTAVEGHGWCCCGGKKKEGEAETT